MKQVCRYPVLIDYIVWLKLLCSLLFLGKTLTCMASFYKLLSLLTIYIGSVVVNRLVQSLSLIAHVM